MVPKGSRDLEPTHLVLVGLDLFQFDHAYFGFAPSGQPLQESRLASTLLCVTFLGVSLKRDLCCVLVICTSGNLISSFLTFQVPQQEWFAKTSGCFVGSFLAAEGFLFGDCPFPQQQRTPSGWKSHDAIDLESDSFPSDLGTLRNDHWHHCSSSCHA